MSDESTRDAEAGEGQPEHEGIMDRVRSALHRSLAPEEQATRLEEGIDENPADLLDDGSPFEPGFEAWEDVMLHSPNPEPGMPRD